MTEGNELQKLNEIAVQVGKLEVLQAANAKAIGDMAASVNRLVERMERSDDVAKESYQQAIHAHKRIDELRLETAQLAIRQTDTRRWMVGTIIAGAAVLLSCAGFLLNVLTTK